VGLIVKGAVPVDAAGHVAVGDRTSRSTIIAVESERIRHGTRVRVRTMSTSGWECDERGTELAAGGYRWLRPLFSVRS